MKPRFLERAAVAAWLGLWFLFVYGGCNYVASLRPHVGSLPFAWERHYPFVPWLIIPYWSIDFLFMGAPFFCLTRFQLGQHLKRITLGIAIAGFFFLNFPLTLAWPRPAVHGWLGPLFGSLDTMNNFYNCAPSLHIVLWAMLWPVYGTPLRGWRRRVAQGWFALIALSTLLCWQHYLLDVITGQLLGLFCIFLFPWVPFVSPPIDRSRGINARTSVALNHTLGALLLLAITLAGWPHSLLLLWPTLSLTLMASAYWGAGPTFLRKWHGRQLPGARWLLGPYRWVAGLTARYFTAGQPPYAQVSEGMWVGRRLSNVEAQALPVQAVLDLCAEYDEVPAFLQLNYKNIPVLDLTAPAATQLKEAVAFLQQNPNCYVHCSLGMGRSLMVAVAFLLDNNTLDEALDQVRRARPQMRLGEAQRRLLEEFSRGEGIPTA